MSEVTYKSCVQCGFILCQIIKDKRGHLLCQEYQFSMDEEILTCSCGQSYLRSGVNYEPIHDKKVAGD
jgi:hypothetical protein